MSKVNRESGNSTKFHGVSKSDESELIEGGVDSVGTSAGSFVSVISFGITKK